jgi:hypothetical protein
LPHWHRAFERLPGSKILIFTCIQTNRGVEKRKEREERERRKERRERL